MARSRRQWGAVRELASGRFQARYRDHDTGKMVPAPDTFPSRKAADRWLAKKRTDLDAGTSVDDRAGTAPLRDWWLGYERSIQHRKARTKACYRAAWRLRIEPAFGSVPVRRIKPNQIDDWIAAMVERGVSSSKVIESVGVLKRVLDRVVRDRAIPSNPAAERSVTLPKRPEMERPVLSPVEVEKLAAAMRWDRDRLLVRLLAYGGLRVGEALALRWSDVDLEHGTVTIRHSVEDTTGTVIVGPTKTYAVRPVTLPKALVTQMAGLVPLSGASVAALVFPNRRGEHLRYRNWRRDQWDPAVLKSGVVALPHDLRATCASLLIDAGASAKDVQAHLGHRDITTTLSLYARVRPGRSEDLAARLDALIAEAA